MAVQDTSSQQQSGNTKSNTTRSLGSILSGAFNSVGSGLRSVNSWMGNDSFLGEGISNGALASAGMGVLNMGVNMLAGQNQTGIGNAMQTIGGLASNIPGVGGLIGAGVGVVGGLVNAAFGSHINEEFVNQTRNQANQIGSNVFNANTNADLLNDWGNLTEQSSVRKSEVGSDGWFSSKASRKTAELNRQIAEANRRQLANFNVAAENVDTQNDFRIMQNMAAYGGPIGSFRRFYANGGSLFDTPEFFTFEPQTYDKGGYLNQAKALIRQNEGWSAKPYADSPKGKNWRSVGYGFNDSGFRDKYPEGISKHYEHGITKKQAEEELDYFLKKAEKQLKSIYGKQWDDFSNSQKAAILDTYYQRPASVGKSSRFYKAVTAGEDAGSYLGVAGYSKRNNIRQSVFGGTGFSGSAYEDDSESLSYPSPILEAISPISELDLSGIEPTKVINPEINLSYPSLDLNFLTSSQKPVQQQVPTVGTVEDFLASYGDFEQNLFKEGGILGNYFEGDGEEPNSLKAERSPHVNLAFNNPWLYNKLHPKQKKREKYTPTTFAGRVAQVSGAKDKTVKYVDYNSSLAQTIPYVGAAISALDLGYDLNKLSHDATLANSKDVVLDAASLLPQLRRTMKGSWLKGNSGTFITDTGQMLYNPRVASALEVALQPYRAIINGAGYTGKLADMIDDSKEFLRDMYNESPVGKYFNEGKKADGGELNIKDMNIFDFGGGLTHGADFDTGINWVNEGDSHGQNPLGGVPMGVDESGVPNLVEEDEAIWNGDYVFSRRMKVPKKLREKYNLSDDATFADAVKKLTKESEERPLDIISRNTQDHILGELADSQEEMRMAKAQRKMEKKQQLQDDFLTGVQFGLGGHMTPMGLVPNEDNTSFFELLNKQFAEGGGIHIDPSKRGTFKAQASKMGMGVQEAASHILANKENYSPAMVKKANFARNASHWHEDGGSLFTNPFAYGGELGNVFEGKGEKDNSLKGTYRGKRLPYEGAFQSKASYAKDMAAAGFTDEEIDAYMFDEGHGKSVLGGYGNYRARTEKYMKKYQPAYYKVNQDIKQKTPSTAAKSTSNNKATNAPFGDFGQMMDTFGTSFTPTFSLTQPTDIATNRGNGNKGKAAVTETPAITPEETGAASTRRGAQGSGRGRGNDSGTATRNRGSVVPFTYDWYRNGSDGYSTPWGFTVGQNGLIDKNTGYTDDYRNLVATLGANDIKNWAKNHADDPSLRSFLDNNYKGKNYVEKLNAFVNDDKFTDDMWRRGATDGKYGFMHHVANEIGKDQLPKFEAPSFTVPEDTSLPEQGLLVFDPKIMGNPKAMAAGTRSTITDPNGTKVTRVTGDGTSDNGLQRSPFKPKQTWTRYAPIAMNALFGLKEMLTPADYGNADAIMAAAYQAGSPVSIGTEYIGDYRKRDPFDETYLMNIINQNSRAANRNFMNISGGNRAAAMSGILANDLVTQRSLAEAARQAYLANRTDDAQVAEFNRGTNIFNAQAQNQRNQFLAQLNSQRQNAMLSGIAQGARLRQAIKDQRDAAISANLTAFAQGLGDLGKENGYYNMLGGLNEEGVLKYFYGDDWKTKFNNVNG